MPEFAVTALGADRPGIIARVTEVLLDHGGNLEDSQMTILRGQFAIMLLVTAEVSAAVLERALAERTGDLGLVVTVRPVGPGSDSPPPNHVVSVYGSDRPGIVHGATQALADAGVNITDLTTRVIEGEEPVYAMLLEVSLPEGRPAADLVSLVRDRLAGVEVSVRELGDTAF